MINSVSAKIHPVPSRLDNSMAALFARHTDDLDDDFIEEEWQFVRETPDDDDDSELPIKPTQFIDDDEDDEEDNFDEANWDDNDDEKVDEPEPAYEEDFDEDEDDE